MKKYLIALGSFFALAICAQIVFAAPYPTGLGGLGTSQTPASGTIPIGNGAGSYTPALLAPGSDITITNASGSVTIAVQGNQFLPSSTVYVTTVNGQSGVVTITSSTLGVATNTLSLFNGNGFTTTTIQSVLNSLSASGLLTYSSTTGAFGFSSSTLNLGTASTHPASDFLASSTNLAPSTTIPTVFVSSFNGGSGAITYAPSTTIPTNNNQLANGSGFITTSTNNFGGITGTGTSTYLLVWNGATSTTAFPGLIYATSTGLVITGTPYQSFYKNTSTLDGTYGSGINGFSLNGFNPAGLTISESTGTTATIHLSDTGQIQLKTFGNESGTQIVDTTNGFTTSFDTSQETQNVNVVLPSSTSGGVICFTSTCLTTSSFIVVNFPLSNASGTQTYTLNNDSSGFLEVNETGTTPGNGPTQPYNIILQNCPNTTSTQGNAECTISQGMNFADGSRTFVDWTTEDYPPYNSSGWYETASGGSSASSSFLFPFSLNMTNNGVHHSNLFTMTPVNATGTWNGVTFALNGNSTVTGNLVENSSGSSYITSQRGTTSNYATISLGTAGTDEWDWQMNPSGGNGMILVDPNNGGDILQATQNGTTTIGVSGSGKSIVLGVAAVASTTLTVNGTTTIDGASTSTLILGATNACQVVHGTDSSTDYITWKGGVEYINTSSSCE